MNRILNFVFLLLLSVSVLYGEPNADLLDSASRGDLDGVKNAISQKANINFKDSNGTSALMLAANNNHFQVVKFLVDNKADILSKNMYGWTAAVMAGARGNTLIKEFLESEEKQLVRSRATGVVLHIAGEVYVENKKLRVGDLVLEDQTVFVAKKSVCDIQVKQSLSEFMLRLKEQTVFTLKYKETPNENVFSGLVKQGSVLFKIKKVFSGEKIQTLTPTTVASVRGTGYEVSVDKEKNTKISLYEGVARTRIRAPEIEDDASLENTPEIKGLLSSLEDNGQIVSMGNSIDVTSEKQKKILEKANAESLRKNALGGESTNTAPMQKLSYYARIDQRSKK